MYCCRCRVVVLPLGTGDSVACPAEPHCEVIPHGNFLFKSIMPSLYRAESLRKDRQLFSSSSHIPPGLPILQTTSSIKSATVRISDSFIPRVVSAGVPMRIPLVMRGDLSSKGTAFLFTVIPAASSASWASFPVAFLLRRSMSIR